MSVRSLLTIKTNHLGFFAVLILACSSFSPSIVAAQEDETATATAEVEDAAEVVVDEATTDAAEVTATEEAKAAEATAEDEAATATEESAEDAAEESDEAATEEASVEALTIAGPAAKEFDAVFTTWKELLKTLRDVRAEYAIAEKADLPKLEEQWTSRIADGKALKLKLDEAAMAAFEEAPNKDRELVRYLITVAADNIRGDNYDAASGLLKKMMDAGCDEKVLPDLAGITAFCTNDFQNAKTYFEQAADNNSLSRQATNYKGDTESNLKLWEEEKKTREAEAKADDLPRVKLETSAGDIVLELFENEAPETVGNFINLVEQGFYDGLTFHRVLDAFMAQGGCPKGTGEGGPGYKIFCECKNENHRKHFAGSLSMAKQTAVNTGGSQFFITFVPTTQLNGKHTVFGRVYEGMDNAIKITRRNPDDPGDAEVEPTKITKATVIRKRDHEYRPNKVK